MPQLFVVFVIIANSIFVLTAKDNMQFFCRQNSGTTVKNTYLKFDMTENWEQNSFTGRIKKDMNLHSSFNASHLPLGLSMFVEKKRETSVNVFNFNYNGAQLTLGGHMGGLFPRVYILYQNFWGSTLPMRNAGGGLSLDFNTKRFNISGSYKNVGKVEYGSLDVNAYWLDRGPFRINTEAKIWSNRIPFGVSEDTKRGAKLNIGNALSFWNITIKPHMEFEKNQSSVFDMQNYNYYSPGMLMRVHGNTMGTMYKFEFYNEFAKKQFLSQNASLRENTHSVFLQASRPYAGMVGSISIRRFYYENLIPQDRDERNIDISFFLDLRHLPKVSTGYSEFYLNYINTPYSSSSRVNKLYYLKFLKAEHISDFLTVSLSSKLYASYNISPKYLPNSVLLRYIKSGICINVSDSALFLSFTHKYAQHGSFMNNLFTPFDTSYTINGNASFNVKVKHFLFSPFYSLYLFKGVMNYREEKIGLSISKGVLFTRFFLMYRGNIAYFNSQVHFKW